MLVLRDENEAYIELLCGHLKRLIRRLRAIPPEKWEWQPALPAPSPRLLAQHAWLWLVCDRHHILEPNAARHPVISDPPVAQTALCDLLEEETELWRDLLRDATPDRLSEARRAFHWQPVNVRWLVYHMIGNVIYKHGQVANIYFMLGLDGEEAYRAPLPQDDYRRLADMTSHPLIRAVLQGDLSQLAALVQSGTDVDERDAAGSTALHYAAEGPDVALVEELLRLGAAVDSEAANGCTALMGAAWMGRLDTVRALLAHGADVNKRRANGQTALADAIEAGQSQAAELLRQAGAAIG